MSAADESTTLQARVEEQAEGGRYGWFAGVFRPTLMTILGVIMFVRLPWVIGNAGVLGGMAIITLAFVIVTLTALSMSCITTNLRIGAGGAYSIISQSLGLEAGGAVGIPLYLAQAFAGAMYIFGFREGLAWFLPWDPLILDLASFAIMFGIAFVSTRFAFRIQYVVLFFMVLGILSSFAIVAFPAALQYNPADHLIGDLPGSVENGFTGISVMTVFAIFFPAATGILAGANMSGELKDPKKDLPFGTLFAIGVSYVIYMALAWVIAMVASPQELVENYTIALDRSAWPTATLGALLGATFSSGLACFVGAPRILQALANHGVIPGSEKVARIRKGEPRNALYVTGIIVFIGVLVRDLNAIAPMITMFFLITYMMVNLVVVVEQSLDMTSFRPGFPVWRFVPILGTLGCLLAMFIINAVVGLVAVAVVLGIYTYLTRLDLMTPQGDMRSGLFFALAEWAAKHTADLPTNNERAWKPSLLLPFHEYREMRGSFSFIRDLALPNGSITLIGLTDEGGNDRLERNLPELGASFVEDGVFARWTNVATRHPYDAIISSMQTLNGAFFNPNILFMRLHDENGLDEQDDFQRVLDAAHRIKMGMLVFVDDKVAKTGQEQIVNVWVRDQSPNWKLDWDLGNIDLELLTAFKLHKNWQAKVRVITAVSDDAHVAGAREFLQQILELARLSQFEICVLNEGFQEALNDAPQADIDLFGLGKKVDFEMMRSFVAARKAACLFVADSGEESILA